MSNKLKKLAKQERSGKYVIPLQLKNIKWEKVENIFSRERKSLLREHKSGEAFNSKELLTILASGAVIALSFFVPVAPMALAPFILNGSDYKGWRMRESVKRLRKQKLVKIVYKDGDPLVQITEKGRMRALRYKLYEMEVKRPKVWDRKWRVVIFDIPEKYKNMRDMFRRHLKIMGFYQLQKSVWVHPYPCFDEIEFLRQIYRVGIDVTYILAEKVENSQSLKKFFKIS